MTGRDRLGPVSQAAGWRLPGRGSRRGGSRGTGTELGSLEVTVSCRVASVEETHHYPLASDSAGAGRAQAA